MPFTVMRLSDVALSELKPCQVTLARYGSRDHCRWVFRGRMPNAPGIFYYKIWNPTYVRRDNVPAAMNAGFYDECLVPALDALIFHDGLCRGYVMREGLTRHGQPLDDFRKLLCARTRETGWFCVQFSAYHSMRYRTRWSLLDLEAVYPLRDLPRLRELQAAFEDLEYSRFVSDLYRSRFGHGTPDGSAVANSAALPPEGPPLAIGLRRPVVRRFWRRPRRMLVRKFRMLVPRTDLIQGAEV